MLTFFSWFSPNLDPGNLIHLWFTQIDLQNKNMIKLICLHFRFHNQIRFTSLFFWNHNDLMVKPLIKIKSNWETNQIPTPTQHHPIFRLPLEYKPLRLTLTLTLIPQLPKPFRTSMGFVKMGNYAATPMFLSLMLIFSASLSQPKTFNVLHYGAVGDGHTDSERVIIQKK